MPSGSPPIKRLRRCGSNAATALVWGWLQLSSPAAPLPSAREVLDRLQAQSARVAAMATEERYSFTKVLVTEDLDARGRVTSRKEKHYDVQWVAGATYEKLKRIDGKRLSSHQLQQAQEEEERNREELGEERPPAHGQKTKPLITRDLLGRFDFQVQGRVLHRGQTNLLLTFKPRADGAPVRKMADRVINRLEGQIWVDEAADEITRAQTHLTGKVSFWAGLLGSLEQFDLVLEREAGAPGVWFNKYADISLTGRKLLDGFRFHGREEATNFQRLTAAGPAGALRAEGAAGPAHAATSAD